MFIKNIIRYFYGQIKFDLKTDNPEIFLNQCIKNKIYFNEVSLFEGGLCATCSVKTYKKLQKIKLNGARRKILRRYGVRFLVNRHKKRWGFLVGFCLMIFLLIYLSGFVWSIDVTGNERLSENVILETLKECGFENGVRKNKTNITFIENKLKNKLYDIAWISINLDGSCAHVEIKERVLIPGMETDNKPSNLIATHDGIILKMEITKGKPITSAGSGVVKGELLVSGVYNDKKDNVIIEHSRGKVTAEVEISKDFTVSNKGAKIVDKEEKTFYSINAFSREIPLHFNKLPKTNKWICQKYENIISIFGLRFPFKIIKYKLSKDVTQDVILNENEIKDRLNLEIQHYESENFSEGKIVDKIVTYSMGNKECVAKVDYIVHINIAEQQYIETEK